MGVKVLCLFSGLLIVLCCLGFDWFDYCGYCGRAAGLMVYVCFLVLLWVAGYTFIAVICCLVCGWFVNAWFGWLFSWPY